VRVENLMWACAARKLKRSDGGDAEHSPGIGLVAVARRGESAGLGQQLDQHDRWDNRVAWKVSLKVPVTWMRDAEATGGLSGDEISDFLD
jgi:hypothetical protein